MSHDQGFRDHAGKKSPSKRSHAILKEILPSNRTDLGRTFRAAGESTALDKTGRVFITSDLRVSFAI